MKLSIKDFFSKCDQNRRKLRVWSYKKKAYMRIKAYKKSIYKEPTVKRCLLILDLKPFRS